MTDQRSNGWRRRLPAALCVAAALAWTDRPAMAAAEKQVSPDPSRAPAYHRIPLFNEDNEQIDPAGENPQPISLRVTCNKCHDYSRISGGWHFNSADPNAPPGRPGQPWILTDVATGTQIPVSARAWPGAWRPKELGLTSWKLVQTFGRHMPGGDFGEKYSRKLPDQRERWIISGQVEVNCLGCHNASPMQDQNLWATNMGRENFRLAATAASGMAHVTGMVKLLPDTFDPLLGEDPDNPHAVPRVHYDAWRFNPKKEVFFDVVRKQPVDRCYYCHTNHPAGKDAPEEWQVPEDVHVARGMRCTECHQNGLDHKISRNYEGEAGPLGGRFTCRGCHLGESAATAPEARKGGHLAAPRPRHAGLPALHLEKLSCTACHSGPLPGPTARRVQTARAHALGFHEVPYSPEAPPYIEEPVFVRQADGRIAPTRMVFPSFWARRKEGLVRPLLPADAVYATGNVLQPAKGKAPKPPTRDQIVAALKALAADKQAGEAVYVWGGRLHRLDGNSLVEEDGPAARPYSWPLAHDVRPATQSLGYDGACTDCHASDSPVLFGRVRAEGLAELGEPPTQAMYELADVDPTYHTLFGLTYIFRPYLKTAGLICVGVVAVVLVIYLIRGGAVVLGALGWRRRQGRNER